MHVDDIQEYVKLNSILCLCETWSITEPNLKIWNSFGGTQNSWYSPAQRVKDRGRASGGIAIIHNSMSYDSKILFISENYVFTSINTSSFKFILGTV